MTRPQCSLLYPLCCAVIKQALSALGVRPTSDDGETLITHSVHDASHPPFCTPLQALSAPDGGETLIRMLVLDHAKLDEAAKAGRGGGGGGMGGLLAMLGMTAEEVMGAMVAAAVER